MKVLQVNNFHRILGGSDVVVLNTLEILTNNGIDVSMLSRDSQKLISGLCSKVRAFASGLYSFSAVRDIKSIIYHRRPDVIHVHEVYPFLSPWILDTCHDASVPIVMTCHDFRLVCPTANLIRRGRACKSCIDKREYFCLLNNCREKLIESFSYFLRSYLARISALFLDNVSVYITPSNHLKKELSRAGISEDLMIVIPNMVYIPMRPSEVSQGQYFLFLGRVTQEKGIDVLLDASKKTELPVQVIGDFSSIPNFKRSLFSNVKFVGFKKREEIKEYIYNAAGLIMPSIWPEVNPLVILEAMSYGLPVIASRIGGIPEMVAHGVTGFLFEPGDSEDLASKMELLWRDKDLRQEMGQRGREKAISEFSPAIYFERIISTYKLAIKRNEDLNR
jgi:glycosyltransferase involved in cell wall biosynthesis